MQNDYSEYSSHLKQAVYRVVYGSRQQRFRRAIALILLIIKHTIRSLYLVWPVYCLILVCIFVPLNQQYIYYIIALLPGLILWCILYFNGIHREYSKSVEGRILMSSDLRKIFKR